MNRMPQSPLPSSVRRLTAGLAATVVAGCAITAQTTPLSFIEDRQVYHRTVLNRFPLVVTAIDGNSTVFHPQPISAGMHLVTFDAAPVAGFNVPVQKTYAVDVDPCIRYYVAAQRSSPLTQDWELVVERMLPAGGCDAATEHAKSQAAIANGTQPQLVSGATRLVEEAWPPR